MRWFAGFDPQLHVFRRVWSIATLALMLVTWKLWTPQTDFPQVPLSKFLGALPPVIDKILLAAAVFSLMISIVAPVRLPLWRQMLVVFVASIVGLVAIDQQRFQPWVYQSIVIAVFLASCPAWQARSLLRWFVISIYLYSAWSKCDYTFLHNLGQQFLQALVGLSGTKIESWPENLRIGLALLFPLGEGLIGGSFLVRRAWPYAVWFAAALHLLLLLILGPLGLDHRPGVLVWNLFFIVQNFLLFRDPVEETADEVFAIEDSPDESSGIEPVAIPAAPTQQDAVPALPLMVIVAALIWPLLEPVGLCDHWPAWSVYAPRVERTRAYVHRSEVNRLPASLHQYLEVSSNDGAWSVLHLDRWSLAALDVPLYPQNRVQVAVAEGVARRFGLSNMRLICFNSAERATGARHSQAFAGNDGTRDAIDGYWLGAQSVRPLLPDAAQQ